MEDEEAKRIQEERDKQLTEEYKKLQNPKRPDEKQLLGSQLLDNIGGKFAEAGSAVMEAAQEDPDTWTDDAIRIGLGGVKNVGTVLGAPGIKQGLQLLGAPAYYVGRGLGYGLEKAGVDPRYGHIVGEVGEWFIPGYGMYKAAGKIVKTGKALNTLSNMGPIERGLAVGTVGAAKPIYKKRDLLKHALLNQIDTSPYMKSKVKLHERALNDEMLHWDTKAVARRSKIDEQFQLDASGLPEGPRKIRSSTTEAARRVKAQWSLGDEVSPADIKVFEESNQSILDGYNWHLHGSNIKVGKTEGHHKGVVRQIFDASNGLNQKYRLKSAKYMEKRIGFELGYHGRNVEPVPIRFHPRVHAIINSRISSSPDRFNVEGIAKRLGFPKNWQSVLTYEERLPLYNEVADAIRESVDAINTSWKVLLSRSDDLTTYSKEEYLDLMLQHKKLDDRLRQVTSPSFMAQPTKTGWDIKDTSTTVLNEILDKSNRSDLRLPYIGKVEPNMAPEIRKVINQENGWQLLKEVLLTNKSAATVMKAYPEVKLTVKQQNSLDIYARTLRSRGKSHRFIDELGMRPDD